MGGKHISKYSSAGIAGVVKAYVGSRRMDDANIPKPLVSVVSKLEQSQAVDQSPAFLFRNYDFIALGERRKHGTRKCTMLDASLATSAAPTFFPPREVEVAGQMKEFKDGGLVANN